MDPGSAAHHAAKSGALRSIRGTALYAAATKGGRVGRSSAGCSQKNWSDHRLD